MNANVATKAYAAVEMESGVQGADPHKLIALLYQGALQAIAKARVAMLRKDAAAKGRAISHAMRIIDEGLKGSLNKDVGGKLAQDLSDLYDYMCLRLLNANLHDNVAELDEVSRLLGEIKEAWDAIRPSAGAGTPAATQPPATANKSAALVYGRM